MVGKDDVLNTRPLSALRQILKPARYPVNFSTLDTSKVVYFLASLPSFPF